MTGLGLTLRAVVGHGGYLTLKPLLGGLERIRHGSLTVVGPEGEQHRFYGDAPGPTALLQINRSGPLTRQLLLRGAEGFAESYLAGDWETPDLRALLHMLALNETELSQLDDGNPLAKWVDRAQHLFRRNSRRGSRRNIAYHYDLGNDFYRLWLDETMTYSAALFDRVDEDLATAQRRKIERVLDRIDAKPGDHILEIGCGWGSFAIAAAQVCKRAGRTDMKVVGMGGSREMIEAIKQGLVTGTSYQQPEEEGRSAIRLAVRYLDGEKLEKSYLISCPPITNKNADEFKGQF